VSTALVTNIVIGLAVAAFVIYRQVIPRPVRERSAARLVLVLGVIGIVEMVQAAKGHSVPARAVVLVVIGLALAVAFGALRAVTMRVWRDPDGVAWRRGSALTITLWIISLAAHIALDLSAGHSSVAKSFTSASIWLFLALTLGVQREIIRARAARITVGTTTA
jgi:hypothetical protein